MAILQRGDLATQSRTAEWFYRIGFISHGFIHLLVGFLALSLVFGEGGRIAGPKGVLAYLNQQPFGKFILAALGFCMLGYVAWKFAQAFANLDHEPDTWAARAKRVGEAIAGFIYASLSFVALRAAMMRTPVSENESSLSASVLDLPGGSIYLMIAGIIVAIVGIQQAWKGFREKFLEEIDTRAASSRERKILRIGGKIGLPARGAVLFVIGVLLLITGWTYEPQSTGTKGALQMLLDQPYGKWLLALIASGLVAYAVFCFIAARYKNFVRQRSRQALRFFAP